MTDLVLGKDYSGNKITISRNEQRRSLYVLGSTGTGKSTLFLNMIKQTTDQDIGLCLLDAHGDLTNQVISITPVHKHKDIILIDISDEEYCVGLNLYESPQLLTKKAVNDACEKIMHMWDKLFHITPTDFPQIREYMLHAAHTIVVNPGYTMADISRLFRDKDFRNKLLTNVYNKSTREFWGDYEALPNFERHNQLAAVRRRLSEFLTDMIIPIVGQAKSTIDMRKIMDARPAKILLVKLDRNQESSSSLIGSLIVSLIRTAGFSRDDTQQEKRKHFLLYSDEFQNFASPDFQSILTELRKYGCGCIMAHQDRHILDTQVPELVRSTLATNLAVFNINPIDAQEVSGRFDSTPKATETKRESILTYKQDIIGHLLHQGHKNERVNEFAKEYLPKLFDAAKQQIDKSPMGMRITQLDYVRYPHVTFSEGDAYAFDPDEVRKQLMALNSYFYNNMTSNRQSEFIFELVEPNPMIKAFSAVLGFSHYYLGQCEPVTEGGIKALKRLIEIKLEEKKLAEETAKSNTDEAAEKWLSYGDSVRKEIETLRNVLFEEGAKYLAKDLFFQAVHNLEIGTRIELYQNRLVSYRFEGKPFDTKNYHEMGYDIYFREESHFNDFIRKFKNATMRLKRDPIMVDSGQHEEKPVAQQTHADKQKEIANMLSGLPNFSAYTRIGGDEYTITVTPPAYSPVNLKAVTSKIMQQNLRDGYIRKRSDVEAEIATRQQPSVPPAPQPQKPAQPNIPAKRKAAIGKICPKCQANNPATSLYCSQDGTKL